MTAKTKASPKKTTRRSKALAKPDPAAERAEWVSLRPKMREEKAVDYDMGGSYAAKSLVRHHIFGLGLVTRLPGLKKMEVLFEDGKKLLRCD